MSRIEIKTGSEGPAHDPYGWEEVTATRSDGTTVTIHEGLVNWVSINGVKQWPENHDWKACARIFAGVAGISLDAARKAHERIMTVCSKCGGTDLRSVAGHPGETLNICRRCDNVVSCDFDESAII
jgi:hypothetical protein